MLIQLTKPECFPTHERVREREREHQTPSHFQELRVIRISDGLLSHYPVGNKDCLCIYMNLCGGMALDAMLVV